MFKTMPMMMRIMMILSMLMVMVMMVLLVKRIVVQVHHAGEGGGEAHPVGDRAVSVQPHHLVLLGHVVQEAEQSFKLSSYQVVVRQIVVVIVFVSIIAIIALPLAITVLSCSAE